MGYTQYPSSGGSSSGVPTYANQAALPVTATGGDLGVTLDTDSLYVYDAETSSWLLIATPSLLYQSGALDGANASNRGFTVGSNTIYMQSATATFPGLVSSAAQTFSGVKTFNSTVITPTIQNSGSITVGGNVTASGTMQAATITATTIITGPNLSGSNTGDVSLTTVGTTPAAQGASLSGQVLTLQPADNTNPGIVSTAAQTFAGTKTFSAPVLLSSGTQAAPSVAFLADTDTGFYRVSSGWMGIAVSALPAMEYRGIGGGLVNIGLIGSANSASSTPLQIGAARALNASLFYVVNNMSTGNASATVLQIANGTGSNYTTVENHANATTAYIGGGSLFGGGANQNKTVITNELTSSASFIAFAINGRTQGNEKARLNNVGMTLQGGYYLALTGTTTGGQAITFFAASSGSAYNLTLPGGVPATNQAMVTSNANGSLSWQTVVINPYTTSGDLVIGSGSGSYVRLAASATDTQVLSISSASSSKLVYRNPVTLQRQIFTANGTFTVPANTIASTTFKVTVTGGGGGGGAGDASNGGGGGGGAGGTAIRWVSGLLSNQTINVVVGAGGPGGGAGGGGASGSASVVSAGTATITTITAGAGSGGIGGGGPATPKRGGAGGTTSSGDSNIMGQAGTLSALSTAGNAWGGTGGGSFFGGGGQGGDNTNTAAGDGQNGDTGGGGGGGGANAGTRNGAGGKGGTGVVIFEWNL